MIDLRRISGPSLVACIVSLALIGLQSLGGLTTPWWPVWLQRDAGIWPVDGYKIAGGQLSEFLSAHPSPAEPVAVIIGSSVAYVGLDTKELQARVLPPRQWLKLSVFGSTICELEPIVDHFVAQGRKPALALVAIELKQFARNPSYRHVQFDERVDVDSPRLLHDLQSLRLTTFVNNCEHWLENSFEKIFPDRAHAKGRMINPLARLRIATLAWLGQNAVATFSPDWRPLTIHVDNAPNFKPADASKHDPTHGYQWAQNAGRGVFDPDFYSTDSETAQSLVRIIRRLREAGATVVTVVMPTTSTFRAKEPANAMTTLEQVLALNFPSDTPPIISLRDAVPDHLYYDISHFNPEGKQLVTAQLIDKLNKLTITPPKATAATPSRATR